MGIPSPVRQTVMQERSCGDGGKGEDLNPARGSDRRIEPVAVPSDGDQSTGPGFGTSAVEADVANVVRLYEAHGKQIFTFCFRQLGNREDAEDATQLTFLNAFRWARRGENRVVNSSILFKIAQNVCLNSKRSAFRRQRIEVTGNLEENAGFVSADDSESDAIIRLPEALRTLPTHQRRAILLREWHGLSYQEIGEELGLSQSAIEGLIFRARRALAGLLTEGLEGGGSEELELAVDGLSPAASEVAKTIEGPS